MLLTPDVEPRRLTCEIWENCTPSENKLELLDGIAFGSAEERDRFCLALIFNMGVKHLLEILPGQSRLALADNNKKLALDAFQELIAHEIEHETISIETANFLMGNYKNELEEKIKESTEPESPDTGR